MRVFGVLRSLKMQDDAFVPTGGRGLGYNHVEEGAASGEELNAKKHCARAAEGEKGSDSDDSDEEASVLRSPLAAAWLLSVIATALISSWASSRGTSKEASLGDAVQLIDAGTVAGRSSYWGSYNDLFSAAEYVDLTHSFSPATPVWQGFGPASVQAGKAGVDMEGYVKKGDEFTYYDHGFQTTQYQLTTDQYGTQLDPPAHWNEFGATISDLPATFTLRPLVVINIVPKVKDHLNYSATVQDVKDWEKAHGTKVPKGSAVFFRSDWSKAWDRYSKDGLPDQFPGVSLEALKFLHRDREILFHGHEPLDTDMTPSLEGEAWLMHNNFAQGEGITNLHKVPEHGCLLSIGFAKPLGGLGGYARYVAICPPGTTEGGQTVEEVPGAPLPRQNHPLRRDDSGVMVPTKDVEETKYCESKAALGCETVGKPVWSA